VSILADYSVPPPAGPAALKAAGVAGALRYLTGPNALTRAEADGLAGQGILVGSILEHGAADILNPSLWQNYGEQAAHVAAAAGQPDWAPIFCAADTPIETQTQVDTALESIHNAQAGMAPFPAGGYGDAIFMLALQFVGIPWRFQAAAWSGGKVARGICILQTVQQEQIGGTTIDVDIDYGVLGEHGLWTPGATKPCPTQASVLALGPTWYKSYGFADPPAGEIAMPEIAQCVVFGELFVPAP
jgi:Domain of unknown function (DUF1906)